MNAAYVETRPADAECEIALQIYESVLVDPDDPPNEQIDRLGDRLVIRNTLLNHSNAMVAVLKKRERTEQSDDWYHIQISGLIDCRDPLQNFWRQAPISTMEKSLVVVDLLRQFVRDVDNAQGEAKDQVGWDAIELVCQALRLARGDIDRAKAALYGVRELPSLRLPNDPPMPGSPLSFLALANRGDARRCLASHFSQTDGRNRLLVYATSRRMIAPKWQSMRSNLTILFWISLVSIATLIEPVFGLIILFSLVAFGLVKVVRSGNGKA